MTIRRCPFCEEMVTCLPDWEADATGHWYSPADEYCIEFVACPHVCPRCEAWGYDINKACASCGYDIPAMAAHIKAHVLAELAKMNKGESE